MDKVTLQQLVLEYGDKIRAIFIDNNQVIFVNYNPDVSVQHYDLRIETIGNTDFLIVPRECMQTRIKYKNYYPIEHIQRITIADESNGYPDPICLK